MDGAHLLVELLRLLYLDCLLLLRLGLLKTNFLVLLLLKVLRLDRFRPLEGGYLGPAGSLFLFLIHRFNLQYFACTLRPLGNKPIDREQSLQEMMDGP